MGKAIKVEDQVYDQLDKLRGKRDSFSDVVRRLLNVSTAVLELGALIGPAGHLDITYRDTKPEE